MHSKRHCIKGAARAQNSGIVVGVRSAQYKKTSREEESKQLQHSGKLGKVHGMKYKTAAAS